MSRNGASRCTCYLGHPDDPTADEEACPACDAAYWSDPVAVIITDADIEEASR